MPRHLKLAAAAAAVLCLSAARGLGPSPSGLYDCRATATVGCYHSALPHLGGRGFMPALNRDGSVNTAYGTTLERCATFCALNWYTLSGVTTSTAAARGAGSNATRTTFAACSCGNTTEGLGPRFAKPNARARCADAPAPGSWQRPAAACLAGAGSCGCGANSSQACGMVGGVTRVFRSTCTPSHGPGDYLCPLRGGRFMENGSDVPYATFVGCFGQAVLTAVPSLGVPPILDASAWGGVTPHYALLCNVTKDPASWYCGRAVDALRAFADSATSPPAGYHAYEPLLTFHALVDSGVPGGGLNATQLLAFQAKIYTAVKALSGHETRVENHGLDCAIEQLYMLKVFPSMRCAGCTYDTQALMRIPNQVGAVGRLLLPPLHAAKTWGASAFVRA